MSADELPDAANLGRELFSRSPHLETGQSCVRAAVEDGSHSIDAVVREAGFLAAKCMFRSSRRACGQLPPAIRHSVRLDAAA
ncbi:hypothetical protein [Noviherbaspirillum aerium]|uniref:hypothetical protein n=1 Tax=Noviherbaspirillum aerium TaxID=2588497 RepID=UPI00124DE1DD|nr:hypothetical protein [Noviherbaspirillum aerium]